jgi:acid stress-induced BolA-like protein IbaG/YrbA
MKLAKEKLASVLRSRLGLQNPKFILEKAGTRWVGDIISTTFHGKRDHERQKMLWDALDSEFGDDSVRLVGMLLAYTPDEWSLGAEESSAAKKVG